MNNSKNIALFGLRYTALLCLVSVTVSSGSGAPDKTSLTQQQYEHYQREGYVVLKGLFSAEEVAEMQRITNELKKMAWKIGAHQEGKVMHRGAQFVVKNEDGSVVIERICWAGAIFPKLLAYGRDKRITHPVAQLLKSTQADHLINQLHYKLPGDNVAFRWHRDVQNRQKWDPQWKDVNDTGSFVQVITAIDDHTEHNAPLKIIPGSHRDSSTRFEPFSSDAELSGVVDLKKIKLLILAAGDTVLMHPGLIHASEPNHSEFSRKTLVNGFAVPGANHAPYPGEGSAEEIDL